jgi:hypothetical protein
LRWDAPANIDKLDLEHYTIQVLSSEEGEEYELNVTGSELEYPFGVILNTSLAQYESTSNLTVSAVSKCSQQGPEASARVTANVNTNNAMKDCIFDSAITFYSNSNTLYTIIALTCTATLMMIIL